MNDTDKTMVSTVMTALLTFPLPQVTAALSGIALNNQLSPQLLNFPITSRTSHSFLFKAEVLFIRNIKTVLVQEHQVFVNKLKTFKFFKGKIRLEFLFSVDIFIQKISARKWRKGNKKNENKARQN